MSSEITRVNPSQLHPTPGYHHVTVVGAGPMAFLAGQCPLDLSGSLVGPGDLVAQIDQVAANAIAALSAVGVGPDRVVHSVIYVVSGDGADLGAAWRRLNESVLGPAFTTASTLLGVAQLGFRAVGRGRSDGRTAWLIAGSPLLRHSQARRSCLRRPTR